MARGSSGGEGRKPAKGKLFHKIKDVCAMTSTEPYVLRYWEQEFPFLAPEKNKAGHRIYTDEDIELVRRIKKLLYDEGYTTAGARRQLERERAGEQGGGEGAAGIDVSSEVKDLKEENDGLRARVSELEADRERLVSSLRSLQASARTLRDLVKSAGGSAVSRTGTDGAPPPSPRGRGVRPKAAKPKGSTKR